MNWEKVVDNTVMVVIWSIAAIVVYAFGIGGAVVVALMLVTGWVIQAGNK